MPPTIQAQLALIAWFPIVLYLFMRFPPQRAVIISFVVAWLFLPQRAAFILPGIPDYDKLSATCYGILLATLIYDAQRITSFKLGWLDLPMLTWSIAPFLSSISNGLGWYDGVSNALNQTVSYGLPYFLGRIYLNNLPGLRKLAVAIFIGGLVYAPLCLFESRMSPQLHFMVYGYHGIRQFGQGVRLGGFRPSVFMQHGLSVGMWMMAATLIGIWLWQSKVLKKLWGIPMSVLVAFLAISFVMVKSTGAYIYLGYGVLTMLVAKWMRTALPILFLTVSLFFYFYQNALTETYITDQAVTFLSEVLPQERIESLVYRFDNEEILVDKARERVVFGWGGYGRNRVYDSEGNDITTTDSLWIIAFGINGLVGLTAITCSLLLPTASFCLSGFPISSWLKPKVAPAAVLGVVVTLYMLDCSLNNQPNPIYTLTSGGIAGLVMQGSAISRTKTATTRTKTATTRTKTATTRGKRPRRSVGRRSTHRQRQHQPN
ncbi:MAG: O-antigen ligase domain-containing protein [Symploca sp. SIO2C1]|nr:O-antigen ligase domain-containing protein [Symploca sp. SIO2C1]